LRLRCSSFQAVDVRSAPGTSAARPGTGRRSASSRTAYRGGQPGLHRQMDTLEAQRIAEAAGISYDDGAVDDQLRHRMESALRQDFRAVLDHLPAGDEFLHTGVEA